MKSNTRILKFVALTVLAAASVSVASAAGLLGQRYASATFDWTKFDASQLDDGRGFTALLNQPLNTNIDLSVSYSYFDSDFEGTDVSGQLAAFSATYHVPVQTVKLYGRAGLGWLHSKVGSFDEDDGVYSLEVGVEVPAGAVATLTPYISWTDTIDDGGDGSFNFGAQAEFEIATKWSLLVDASIDEDENWGLSGGVAFRF